MAWLFDRCWRMAEGAAVARQIIVDRLHLPRHLLYTCASSAHRYKCTSVHDSSVQGWTCESIVKHAGKQRGFEDAVAFRPSSHGACWLQFTASTARSLLVLPSSSPSTGSPAITTCNSSGRAFSIHCLHQTTPARTSRHVAAVSAAWISTHDIWRLHQQQHLSVEYHYLCDAYCQDTTSSRETISLPLRINVTAHQTFSQVELQHCPSRISSSRRRPSWPYIVARRP